MAARLRAALIVAALLPALALGAPLQWVLQRLRLPARRTLPMLFHRWVCRVLRVRIRQIGRPAPGPCLVVSNHVSWLDITVISAAAPVSFIAKAEIASWPVFGTLARLQRSIFVDRADRLGTGAVNAGIAARLGEGDALVLFAEGTTGDGNRLLPFRTALLGAVRNLAGAPLRIQPLAVSYVARDGLPLGRAGRPDIAWYGDMKMLPHLAQFIRGGPLDVVLSWGEPLPEEVARDRKRAAPLLEAAVRGMAAEAVTGRALPRPATVPTVVPAATNLAVPRDVETGVG